MVLGTPVLKDSHFQYHYMGLTEGECKTMLLDLL